MLHKNKTAKTRVFATIWTAVIGTALVLVLGSCGLLNGVESVSKSGYVKVDYDKLAGYLRDKASAAEVNYIEITGTIPAAHFKGQSSGLSPLVTRIKSGTGGTKKIALKLPKKIEGLTDMTKCFMSCEELVSLENIPEGVVNMESCFLFCNNLVQAPNMPASVKNMSGCFANCRKLVKVPRIPEGVENMDSCFSVCEELVNAPDIPAKVTQLAGGFNACKKLKTVTLNCNYNSLFDNLFGSCESLQKDGIRVKKEHYDAYTKEEALNKMKVPGDTIAEKKGKFKAI